MSDSAAPATGAGTALEEKMAEVSLENGSAQSTPVDTSGTAASTQPSSVAASLRDKTLGPLKTPLTGPVESAKPPPTPELTTDQQTKYEAVLETVKSWKEIPAAKGKGGPVTESEIMWLTRECILRYLRATKWSTSEAAKRLLGTLTWRREYGVEGITGNYISPENETGKQLILGYDIDARPCLYFNPANQNTEVSPRQVQHLVFMLERVVDLMAPGQEKLSLLIDFKPSKKRTNTAPGIGQGREVLNIIQTHYPERLGRALITNVPWVVWGFFKLITPFIDPITREKLKFNEDLRLYVPPQQLWKDRGGDLDFEYDHDTYWPALVKLCQEKHAEHVERWVKGGKKYGESELYIQDGNAPRLGEGSPQETVQKSENGKEDVSPKVPEDSSAASVPVQTHGTQANGNMDIIGETMDPVLTTAEDKS